MTKGMQLQRIGRAIFGQNNLIGTDFEDISVSKVKRKFVQDGGGVLIQFSISNNALGKISTKEFNETLEVLLGEHGDDDG